VPAQHFLAAQDRLQQARQATEARLLERGRTDVTPISTGISDDGRRVTVAVLNAGQTRLADVDRWDVIVQYYDASGSYHIDRLAYFAGAQPANGEWVVNGVYLQASGSTPELYEPGIFNPAEKMTLELRISPAAGRGITGLVVVGTANGLRLSDYFTRPCLPPVQPGDPPDCSAP
jgi:hypothetical protein